MDGENVIKENDDLKRKNGEENWKVMKRERDIENGELMI